MPLDLEDPEANGKIAEAIPCPAADPFPGKFDRKGDSARMAYPGVGGLTLHHHADQVHAS
jgi:hypothetical protein